MEQITSNRASGPQESSLAHQTYCSILARAGRVTHFKYCQSDRQCTTGACGARDTFQTFEWERLLPARIHSKGEPAVHQGRRTAALRTVATAGFEIVA
jgi:hypothetical protein